MMDKQTPLFQFPPVIEKAEPTLAPVPKKQWYIVRTEWETGAEWFYWQKENREGWVEVANPERRKPKRWKMQLYALARMHEMNGYGEKKGYTYSVREWVEND